MKKIQKTYNLINKSLFKRGVWDNEPDEVEWFSGKFNCLILRVDGTGHLCGYVGLPEEDTLYKNTLYKEEEFNFNVHRGITFTGFLHKRSYWYIGFDCAHAGDFLPYSVFSTSIGRFESYKDITFVTKEVKSLCKQIKEYTK